MSRNAREKLGEEEYLCAQKENRIFVATFFNDGSQNLCGLIEKLNSKDKNWLKPVPVEKIHITWKFIGNIASVENEKIFNIVKTHSHMLENGVLKFDKLDIWPNLKYPKLLVLTSGKYNNKFKDYFHSLDESLYETLKIKKEKRKFIPHITVARIKNNISGANEFNSLDFEPIKLKIKFIQVVESINTSKGVLYKVLFSEEV